MAEHCEPLSHLIKYNPVFWVFIESNCMVMNIQWEWASTSTDVWISGLSQPLWRSAFPTILAASHMSLWSVFKYCTRIGYHQLHEGHFHCSFHLRLSALSLWGQIATMSWRYSNITMDCLAWRRTEAYHQWACHQACVGGTLTAND